MPCPVPKIDTGIEYWYGEEKAARKKTLSMRKRHSQMKLKEFKGLAHDWMMFPETSIAK